MAPDSSKVVFLVGSWYALSALCSASTKSSLNHLQPHSCAVTVTAVQIFIAMVASGTIFWCLGRASPPRSAMMDVIKISIAYTAGFLLLNLSYGRLAASFAETVRGLEPLFSIALVKAYGARGSSLSKLELLSVLTLLLGASIFVFANPVFSVKGFLLGLASNLMFAFRSLLTTQMQDRVNANQISSNKPVTIDSFGLFFYQHCIGLVIVVAAAISLEGATCTEALIARDDARFNVIWSAVGFYGYNQLSLIVLMMLNAVTHSVLNSLRRAVTIVAAAIIFSTPISSLAAMGTVIIVGSSIAFSLAKRAAAQVPADGSQETLPFTTSAESEGVATRAGDSD